MTISELIEELEKIKEKHGDIDVEYQYNDEGYTLLGSSDISEVYVEKRASPSFIAFENSESFGFR